MKFMRLIWVSAIAASVAIPMADSSSVLASDPVFVEIDVYNSHAFVDRVAGCGIDSTNMAWCWGSNFWGQLGDGTTDDSAHPVPVGANDGFVNTNVSAISVSQMGGCAIEEGVLYCWGLNSAGSVGDGTSTQRLLPVKVADSGSFVNSGVKAVDTGSNNTCAIDAQDSVYCWGTNASGRLGLGIDPVTTAAISFAQPVADNNPFVNDSITKVEVGYGHTCVLRDAGAGDRRVFCWGSKSDGRIDGTSYSGNQLAPVAAPTGSGFLNTNVTDFSTGEGFTCAVEGGAVYCWGGATGGTTLTSPGPTTPIKISAASGFTNTAVAEISSGMYFSCAVEAGSVYCWGNNYYGQLGDGTTTASSTAVKVGSSTDLPNTSVADLDVSPSGACALEGGAASCWGLIPGSAATDAPALTPQPVTFLSVPVASDIDVGDVDTSGGTLVITGSGFTGTTSVTFGSTTATFTVDNDGQITITVPALDAGDVVLTIVTPGGTITETITISAPTTTTSSTTTTVAPSTTAAPTTAAPTTTVAEGASALVNSSNQEVLTATAGTGVLLVDGEPVEVRIVQAGEDLRRSVPGARTAEQVTALRAVAADMLAEIRTIIGDSAEMPVTVVDVATGAVVYGLVTDPVTNEQLAVPIEDIAFITGGGIALMVGGADGEGDPANIAFDGVLEFGEGGFVSLLAYGLIPGAEGEIVVMSDPLLLDTFEVGADGGVSAQAEVPGTLEPGAHTVVVTIGDQAASLGFRVLPAGTLPSTGGDNSTVPVLLLLLAAGSLVALAASRRRQTV